MKKSKVLLVTPPYHAGVVESAGRWPNLAFIYMAQGQTETALKTMLQASALNPRSENYSLTVAQMYLMNRQYDQAIAALAEKADWVAPAGLAAAAPPARGPEPR
mgnify:CR=1 FL=1